MRRLGTIWSAALVLVLSVFALFAPHQARAQTGESSDQIPELSQDWEVRVGMYVFQSKTARSTTGEVGISGNVNRRVYAGRGYDVTVGIGYNGIDPVYNIPLTVNLIAHKDNLRYGLGAGYAFGKRANGRGIKGTVLDLLLGYQLTRGRNPMSVDLRYLFVGGSSNETDGYSLTLGLKF